MADDKLSAALEEIRDYADMIIPWSKVQLGDLALDDGSLMLVDRISVLAQSEEYPDFFIAYAWGRRADDDGTVSDRAVSVSPNAATLTAVRRAVQCALCGAVLARAAPYAPWVRRDQPGRGEPLCSAGEGDERLAHEPTVLGVADYSTLRLALADLEEANARRCFH